INVLWIKIEFQAFQKFFGIFVVFAALHKRQQKFFDRPAKFVNVLVVLFAELVLFVTPMRGDAFFSDTMHLFGSDLNLKWLPRVADNGRMKGLIQIVPRNGYPVLKTLGNGRPDIVYDTECEVAVLSVVF